MNLINDMELAPFFDDDIVNLNKYPNDRTQSKLDKGNIHKIDFTGVDNELKKELKSYLENLLKKDTTPNYFRARLADLQRSIDYLGSENRIKMTTLKYFSHDLEVDFERYLRSIGIKPRDRDGKERDSLKVFRYISDFLINAYPDPHNFNNDVWDLSLLGIDERRISKSDSLRKISFESILNQTNKNLLKKYLKYQIEVTDKSINTIYSRFRHLHQFIVFLRDKPLTSINREDVIKFLNHLGKKDISDGTFNYYVFSNSAFMEYLVTINSINLNHFYRSDVKSIVQNHAYKTIDEVALNRIFKVLPKIPQQESVMFLLLYATGMRISDVCTMKRGSLFNNNNGFFVKYYSRKMRKGVVNPVPESLYRLLQDYEKNINGEHRINTEYMFSHDNRKCYPSTLYRKRMKKWFYDLDVKNSDGSIYCFRPHDYRHTLATTMILHDIPSYVVQKILHHESIEMTSSYIDIQDQQKIEKHKKFINIKGKSMPIYVEKGLDSTDIAKVEWLKKSINAQILPNGMCALPVVMGKCPHGNSCLTCKEFRTSKEFLVVHKNQYEKTCSFLMYAQEKGWQRQVEVNEEIKKNLEIIISKLEAI